MWSSANDNWMSSQPLKILVLHVGGLTETTLGLPALRALREHFSSSHICIATSASAAELARLGRCADMILPITRLGSEMLSPSLFYRSLRSARLLRQSRFDLAIELHQSPESSLLLQLVKAGEYLTAASAPSRTGLIHTIERLAAALTNKPRPSEHLAQRYLRRLEPLGVRPIETEPRLTTDRDADVRMEKWLKKNAVTFGELLVGLHPGAGARINRWPLDRFVSIGRRLIHNFNARLIVVGGPSERSLVKQLVKAMPEKRALALQAPELPDLVSILARLSVFVSNHSGPAHVAAALRTPVVVASSMNVSSDVNPLSATHVLVRRVSAEMIPEEEIYEAACRLIRINRASSLWAP